MHAITTPGRWIWGLSGLVTTVALAVPGTRLIVSAGLPSNQDGKPQPAVTRVVTIPQPVTSLDVQSYGDPVQITAGPARRVQVTEIISYGKAWGGPPPAVTQTVTGGHLSLADPACAYANCDVAFSVVVPSGVSVSVATQGGDVRVSGVAGAKVDSGGGQVYAAGIQGPLTVSTEGGSLLLDSLAGPLSADTGGGDVAGQGVAATTATITTSSGNARIAFATAPDALTVSTDGGTADLMVPGGPYAVTADSGGGDERVSIGTDPTARRSIAISTGGGPLRLGPPMSQAPPVPPAPPAPPASAP
jgi:hypothetical protein